MPDIGAPSNDPGDRSFDIVESDWEEFETLPGTHLHWRQTWPQYLRGVYELRDKASNVRAVAEFRPVYLMGSGIPRRVGIGNRTYRVKSMKGIAAWEALDPATGEQIVRRTGANAGGKARMVVESRSGSLRFPVEANWPRRRSLMAGEDIHGHRILRFRRTGYGHINGMEVVVAPNRKLDDELILIITMSSSSLGSHFMGGGSGG